MTSNSEHTASSASEMSSNGSSSLALKFSCERRLSREMPKTCTPALVKSSYWSRKFMASVVQPGVLSFG
ncbi:hypothetical protein D3C81_2303940 [compost metagenome]